MACWISLICVMILWLAVQPQYASKIRRSDGGIDLKVKTGFCLLLFAAPCIVAGFRLKFEDTGAYISKFLSYPVGMDKFSSVVGPEVKSKLYVGIEYIFKTFISENPQMWLLFVALIQSLLVVKTLQKYSCDVGFSVFLFVAMAMSVSWMGNGARQFLAVSVCFACTKFLLEGKWYIYYPVLILMMGLSPIANRFGFDVPMWFFGGIHQATLILILSSFFIKGKAFGYKVWIVAFVFVVLAVSGGLNEFLDDAVENTTYVNDLENVHSGTGTSVLRVLFSCIPMILALINKPYLDRESTPDIIKLSANASVITSVLYIASALTSGIYVGRLPVFTEMYNLILVPWLINHPLKKSKSVMTALIVVVYLFFFYYQVGVTWKGRYIVGIYKMTGG